MLGSRSFNHTFCFLNMSHASSLFSSNQAHLLDRATALVQTHPLECSTALMCILLGGYTLRHLFMPSNYANIDGPRNNSILSGTYFV
jgi:hypothetical protein